MPIDFDPIPNVSVTHNQVIVSGSIPSQYSIVQLSTPVNTGRILASVDNQQADLTLPKTVEFQVVIDSIGNSSDTAIETGKLSSINMTATAQNNVGAVMFSRGDFYSNSLDNEFRYIRSTGNKVSYVGSKNDD